MLELAPDFALGYNNLANAYYMKGEYEEAVRNCDKAAALGFEVHPEFLKLLDPYRRKESSQMIDELFSQYQNEVRKADILFKTIAEKYPLSVKCRIRCCDCCNAVFGIFPIEAAYIHHHLRQARQKDKKRCAEEGGKIRSRDAEGNGQTERDF